MQHSIVTRSAFTIVEILVVVALILVLLSLVIVAVGSATRTAQRTNTSALMSNIKQALVQFENDIGYLPPVLDHGRNLEFDGLDVLNGPDPRDAGFENDIQQWYSVTSLAEFLVGYGTIEEDANDGPGIRHPGPDGFWGATNPSLSSPGSFTARTQWLDPTGSYATQSESFRSGRVYGPYLELTDNRLLGAIDPSADPDANGNYQVFFPGEAGYDDTWPKVIVDYWGEPIRYYRKPYPQGSIDRAYRAVRQSDGSSLELPTLADVYLLRPWELGQSAVDTRFGDGAADASATTNLLTSDFALFSSGPDRRLDQSYRRDDQRTPNPSEFNRDNIVELGP